MRLSVTLVELVLLLVAMPAFAQNRRPIQVTDLFRLQRLGDPQVSPDGKTIAYTVTKVDLEANKTRTNIWVVGAGPHDQPRQLTASTKSDRHPRWSPDSKQILFESTRSGEGQLWVIDLAGGEARQLTTLATGANGGIWSPDGKKVGFISAVYPEYSAQPFKESDALNKKKKEEIEKNPVKARVFTKLFYRHWDEWVEDKRQHLFVVPAQGGDPLDVTPGDRDANPTSSTFSVGDDFTFSPDSKFLLYTAVPAKNEAWSTNYDICRVSVGGGKVETPTKDNLAADGTPCFSPDGKYLIYRRQLRCAGFESDRWQLMLVDSDANGRWTGKPRSVTPELDTSVSDYAWAGNERILFTAEIEGSSKLFSLDLHDKVGFVYQDRKLKTTKTSVVLAPSYGSQGSPSCDREGRICAFTLASLSSPPEIDICQVGHTLADVIVHRAGNEAILKELDLPRPQSVTVPGAGGTPVQMWILQPPGFNPKKKWPLVFLVHGGPQGAWEDSWSNRWNPEVWAAQGYVVALPNPRGSTGFGQQFTNEISGDWGGRCFEDLMACLAYLEKQPYIDINRMAAAGASFGGYMMNWFEGHTTQFKTLITHCGVYNFDSMYATTDEIWFDEWEHGGPPWGNRESYEKFSPHRYAKNFKTPMLIIHNNLDFRVPLSEGYQLFSTLQRLGVPSRLVNFPDEGHWVLKPANSKFWHQVVFDWLEKYVAPGGK